jgi:hypothetical protein
MRLDVKKELPKMSILERLQWIAGNAGGFNLICKVRRPGYMQETLEAARDILPAGEGKRALAYICANDGTVLCYGGNDVVRPALLEAVELLAKKEGN